MKQHSLHTSLLLLVDRVAVALLVAAMALACALPLAGSALGAQPARGDTPSLLFCYLDANRDGMVSLIEARRLRGFEVFFRQADEDHDGRLNRQEFIRAQALYDQARGAAYASDTEITYKIKTALVQEDDLRALAIMVETYDGQVILGGIVDSPARARKVIDLATGVPGVESVKSTLEINNRT